jgi:hypothetical protein
VGAALGRQNHRRRHRRGHQAVDSIREDGSQMIILIGLTRQMAGPWAFIQSINGGKNKLFQSVSMGNEASVAHSPIEPS